MGLRDHIRNAIWRMDLFSTTPTFRTRKEPVYETLFGGIMSLVVLAIFYYFLYTQLAAMLSKLTITFNQGTDDNIHSSSTITQFPIAVAIEGVDLSLAPRKFILQLWQ